MGNGVQVKVTVIRLLISSLMYLFVFKSYYLFITVMNQVIDLHLWYLDVCWGIFGVVYAKVFLDRVMPFIYVPLKMIDLASVATGSGSVRECAGIVLKRFGDVAAVVAVNKLLHVVLSKVYDGLETDRIKQVYDKLKNSSVKSAVGLGEKVLSMVVDNMDECVLCSCFMLDGSLFESLTFSIKNLWKSLKDIALSVASLQILAGVVNACVFCGYVYFAVGIWEWSLQFVVKVFLYYYIMKNLIKDVVYEPMIYRIVCGRFVDEASMQTSDYAEEVEQVLSEIPELEKIKSIVEKTK